MLTNPISVKQRLVRARKQGGSVIITVCLILLFLLGFMGIAMDFGHMFTVKTELQTAMDSCALAAAQELDAQPTSIERAQNAGRTAGNLNGVDFQNTDWELTNDHITFKDASYTDTTISESARYVECRFTQENVRMWLLHVAGAFVGDTAAHPQDRPVLARAVASRGSALTSCPIPVALLPRDMSDVPNYGFVPGEWIKILDVDNNNNPYPQPGEMGWFNINGTQGAQDTKTQLSAGGVCGTEVDDDVSLSTLGAKQGVAPYWNARFGIYRGGLTPEMEAPDLSGYGYDSTNWPAGSNAYPDFVEKRASYTPHPGGRGWTPISSAQHEALGYNRRIVTVPVLGADNKVIDFACMFMLEPMWHPLDPVFLEFLGNAGSPGVPCTTNGMAGALAGPKVPVLVR